jgi:HSP20 family protein
MSSILRRNDFFGDSIFNAFGNVAYEPRANVSRTKTGLLLEVELPGFSRSEISVEARNGTLNIGAERSAGKTEYERQEFGTPVLKRTWSLPRGVNLDNIDATYEAGILSVTIPYKTETTDSQRKIEIR